MTLMPRTIAVIRGELIRLAVVLAAAASLSLALGMIFLVHFTLDTDGYRRTDARSTAAFAGTGADLDALRHDLGGERVALFAEWVTRVSAGDRVADDVGLEVILGDDPDVGLSLLPDAARVAGTRVIGDDSPWIDISSELARALAVAPGDAVEVTVGGDVRVRTVVRGVYAVRDGLWDATAIVAEATLASAAPPESTAAMLLATTADAPAVARMLEEPRWRDQMLRANYTLPLTAESMDDRLAAAEENSFANLSIVLAVSGTAVVALLAIIVGESVGIMRIHRRRADLLVELGARPARVHIGAAVGVSAVTALALTVGSAVGATVFTTGAAAPDLPPSLAPAWVLITSAGVGVGLFTTSLIAGHRLRKETR